MITQEDIDAFKDESNPEKMIQVPNAGESRGHGTWEPYLDFIKKAQMTIQEGIEYWEELQITKYLPTKVVDKNGL